MGQYNYGYQSQDQSKAEVKTADGVVRGAYSYVDANGIVQSVNYISDALGFRVAATNLPVHVVEETAAVAAPAAAEVVNEAAPGVAVAAAPSILAAQVPYAYLPYALNYAYQVQPTQYTAAAAPQPIFTVPYHQPAVVQAAPATYVQAAPAAYVQAAPAAYVQAAPLPIAAAPAPLATQYHSQDEAGQYAFGYTDGSSDRQEVKTADGVVRGAYHYVDTNGLIQTVEYIADNEGFRVAGTNLPTHLAGAPLDTPEVAAAKAEHALLYNQAAAEAALQPDEEVEGSAIVEAAAEPEAYYGAAVVSQPLPIVANSAPVVDSYYGAGVAPYATFAVPTPVAVSGSQYHAQDDLGQYNYGYSDANSEKQEIKTADGVVRGSYRYVDSDGLIQTVNYIADALGFRVGATNLPVHVIPTAVVEAQAVAPAVAAADQPVVAAYNNLPVLAPQVSYAYLPYASNYAYNSPLPIIPTAVAAAAPEAVVAQPIAVAAEPIPIIASPTTDQNSQFHAQDELGQYTYGYSNPTQPKNELQTADGVVRGAYSYVDANGIVQTVNYISDALGFRVAATNLPVHVVEGAGEAAGVAEVSVAAVEEAKLREANVLTPQVAYAYLPYAQSYAYNMPTAISA